VKSTHNGLIHLALDVVGGEDSAINILSEISELGKIISISSVYKRYLNKAHIDLSARFEVVLHFETLMSVEQTLQLLLSLSAGDRSDISHKCNPSLTLLVFDELVQMSPHLTLPYPLLHTDSLIIRCASEIWGEYEHPILQKTLREISKSAASAPFVEFHMQGKSLVDF
jgi:7,8-dihydro-6-hydroxymethylpterin-pyrophosphokinase